MSELKRRDFMKAVGLGAGAAAMPRALRAAAAPAKPQTPDKPNFIIIFCDDMGYADIGPFGATGYTTPNLDRMAKEGTVFTDFHVARSVCSPSRAALLTGCYPIRVGVPSNFGPSSRNGMKLDATTFAQIVKQKGYATAMYGKWHLGHRKPYLPTSRGFDEWFGLPYSNDMWPYHPEARHRFPDLPLMEGKKVVKRAVQPADQVHLTTWYSERAVKFIERNKDRPFLIYLPHAMPHVPLFVSQKYKGKTNRGLFGDVIAEIDWGVGQILDALKRTGIDEKTLVLFTSDNGPWLSYGSHAGSAAPLREGKGTSFEGGFRVPCVMRWPGKIPAGRRCDELAATIDVLPTIAALIGAKLPAGKIDGKDIRPLMFGRPGAKTPHEVFYYYAGFHLQAIRSGKWKLMFPHGYRTMAGRPGGKGGKPAPYSQAKTGLALYDLQADIGETTDVKDKHPDVVKRLKALADVARKDLGDRSKKPKGKKPAKKKRPS